MNALLDPAAKLVIAHRGNSAFFPENTLESFQQGMALGADAIEFDVRLSRDGAAVVIHDPTVDLRKVLSAAQRERVGTGSDDVTHNDVHNGRPYVQ